MTWLTVAELAARLGVRPETARARRRLIRHRYAGGNRLLQFDPADVARYEASLVREPVPTPKERRQQRAAARRLAAVRASGPNRLFSEEALAGLLPTSVNVRRVNRGNPACTKEAAAAL